jgi:hypothetical protein
MITLRRNNHIIMVPKRQSRLSPSIEMRSHVDSATNTLRLPDGPILIKARSTHNGRRIGTAVQIDVVRRAVDSDAAFQLSASGWVISAEGLDDVVLDERVLGPAVNGEVAVASGIEGSAVRDVSGMCWLFRIDKRDSRRR